jgi:hypothetical protein
MALGQVPACLGTGTPARLAVARMWATAANRAYCQKSSVCHQATSSSRSRFGPALEGRCGQHCVLELVVLAAAEGALGQEPLA